VSKLKILAIKFKYLGDVAVAIPAIRALRHHYPDAELHVLVASDARPILDHLPWIDKVWSIPRKRGQAQLRQTLPILNQLRCEKFDMSVDFVSNDRGALISRFIGAKQRLGILAPKGFWGRKWLYTQTIEEADTTKHEVIRDISVLAAWGIPCPENLELEIHPNPSLAEYAKSVVHNYPVICHLSTSQPKKEMSIAFWKELCDRLEQLKIHYLVSTGPSEREKELMRQLRSLKPNIPCLPDQPDLEHLIAVLAHCKLLISPDTAPLHLAAGLGIPTIALFGPTASSRWAPIGNHHIVIQAPKLCPCSGHTHVCLEKNRCIDTIDIERALHTVQEQLKTPPTPHIHSNWMYSA
jgi:heptosyltransferase-3